MNKPEHPADYPPIPFAGIPTACIPATLIGALFSSILLISDLENLSTFKEWLELFIMLTLVSGPILLVLSIVAGPCLIALLYRYHRQRAFLFPCAGGLTGVFLSVGFLIVSILVQETRSWPDVTDLLLELKFVTAAFCYGAATGGFTAFNLRKYSPDA